jgi:hypothetical protein
MTWDLPALLSIRQEGVLWTFIALKKSIALAGFEPANFWSSGKHTNHYTTKATQHTVHHGGCDRRPHPLRGYRSLQET